MCLFVLFLLSLFVLSDLFLSSLFVVRVIDAGCEAVGRGGSGI